MMSFADKKGTTEHHDIVVSDAQHVAAHATDFGDHDATIWQTVRRNPWASAWCMYACWTVVLVAFETQASGAVVGIPQFREGECHICSGVRSRIVFDMGS